MSDTMTTHHWGENAMSPCGRQVASAYSANDHGFTSGWDTVDCPKCLALKPGPRIPVTQEQRMADQRQQWTIEAVAGGTDLGLIDWLKEKMGVGAPTPRQVPPRMEDERGIVDGVFIFTDVHLGEYYTMEVVPQLSGNVEITVSKPKDGTPEDGHLFTLSHLDRADLFRALLYEFHYSPERGGPND